MITPSKTRRPLKFKTVEELNADLDQLQSGSYEKGGNWSLAQACHHLAMTIEGSLTPPERQEPTPEETAMKAKFFGMILSPDGMPENLPIGNPALVPPPDCTDAEVTRLKTAMQTLRAYPHKSIKVGRCGPVPVGEVIGLHLEHAAHHLSFLLPPGSRRRLHYADVDAAIADAKRVRLGYLRAGQWTLPQACRHLTVAINNSAHPAIDPATPEQIKMQPVLASVLASGKIPSGLEAPAKAVPPTDCDDADIQAYFTALEKVRNYSEPTALHARFGPLNNADYKKLTLIHAAHHFSYLLPTTGN